MGEVGPASCRSSYYRSASACPSTGRDAGRYRRIVGPACVPINRHSCEGRNPGVSVGQASSLSKNDGQDARPTKTGSRIESGVTDDDHGDRTLTEITSMPDLLC